MIICTSRDDLHSLSWYVGNVMATRKEETSSYRRYFIRLRRNSQTYRQNKKSRHSFCLCFRHNKNNESLKNFKITVIRQIQIITNLCGNTGLFIYLKDIRFITALAQNSLYHTNIFFNYKISNEATRYDYVSININDQLTLYVS